jgi:hypothetical protein
MRPLWPSQQKMEELGEENDEFGHTKYHCSYLRGFLPCRKVFQHVTNGFTSLRRKAICCYVSPLKFVPVSRY